MIDVGLMDLIRQALEVSTADVNEAREALLVEQRSADARYAASSALVHPEGSTTPINEAYSRAQDRVADLRAKALKELPAAFKLLLALQVAEERRAEALKHRDMKLDQAFAKDTLGVDPAVADWFARLHNHGVYPHHLRAQAAEMVAIIADLVTWKAKDAKFRDPDNPWRAILQVYASRRIEKPLSKRSKARRSVPGTPTRDRHISDLGDYMFNEMVDDAWTRAAAHGTGLPLVAATNGKDEEAVADLPASINDAVAEIEGQETATVPDAATDPYALPIGIPADLVNSLRTEAEEMVENDHEDWNLELDKALGFTRSLPLNEALARVEAAGPSTWTTSFDYFLEAAQAEGIAAGWQAYREATIRRFMFEIAVLPRWAEKRTRLGIA